MSSRDSSFNEDEFEKISNPDLESLADSVKREESPELVDEKDVDDSSPSTSDSEIQRLREFIEELQTKIVQQDERIFNLLTETEHLTEENEMKDFTIKQLEEEKTDNTSLVSTLLAQLEEEKAKQAGVMDENMQLKEAMERMSLADTPAPAPEAPAPVPQAAPAPQTASKASSWYFARPGALPTYVPGGINTPSPQNQAPSFPWYRPPPVAIPGIGSPSNQNLPAPSFPWYRPPAIQQPQPAKNLEFEIYKHHQQQIMNNLHTQLADYTSQVTQLKKDLEERDQKKQERKAKKAEKRARDPTLFNPYEPIWKTQKSLTEELKLADEQIGIIVEHNDYLRTVEANEHSQELSRLRLENEQLNSTICYLKQQLI